MNTTVDRNIRSHPAINADAIPSYPGGKNGAGVYQTLINMIPPHETYIETHLGGGAIMRHKRAAAINIGIDADPAVIDWWNSRSLTAEDNDASFHTFLNFDAARWIKFQARGGKLDESVFVYADPPYLMETRKGGKLYNYEYTNDQHRELLGVLKGLNCMVMISGYWSKMYADELRNWNSFSFTAQTRQGPATEWAWYNYDPPIELHDYSFLGKTYRSRERIKRQRNRWVRRLMLLPILERRAMYEALSTEMGLSGTAR